MIIYIYIYIYIHIFIFMFFVGGPYYSYSARSPKTLFYLVRPHIGQNKARGGPDCHQLAGNSQSFAARQLERSKASA